MKKLSTQITPKGKNITRKMLVGFGNEFIKPNVETINHHAR